MRCLAFLTFSGLGSEEPGDEDNSASLIGENTPRLDSLGDSACICFSDFESGDGCRTCASSPRTLRCGSSKAFGILICPTDGGAPICGGAVTFCCSWSIGVGLGETTSLRPLGGDLKAGKIPGGGAFCSLLVCLCGRAWDDVLAGGDSRGKDSEDSFGCGDALINSSDVFSPSSMSSS